MQCMWVFFIGHMRTFCCVKQDVCGFTISVEKSPLERDLDDGNKEEEESDVYVLKSQGADGSVGIIDLVKKWCLIKCNNKCYRTF